MNTLYYLRFNNYYNRIVKKYNTISEYTQNCEVVAVKNSINFIPGDGVMTSQIVNWPSSNNTHPDYLLVADETGNILLSRWFIIENERTSGSQYKQLLKRDTIVDNYDNVINAPMFIEKATVGQSDPAIYNKESMTFNQIKKSETLLKDKSKCPWLVGYVARDYKEKVTFDVSTYYDYELSSIDQYKYINYSSDTPYLYTGPTRGNYLLYNYWVYLTIDLNHKYYKISVCSDKTVTSTSKSGLPPGKALNAVVNSSIRNIADYLDYVRSKVNNTPFPDLTDLYSVDGYNVIDQSVLVDLYSERNKIIKVGTEYYRVIADYGKYGNYEGMYPSGVNQASIYGSKINGLSTSEAHMDSFGQLNINPLIFKIEKIEQSNSVKGVVDFSLARTHCTDQPFDVFCMPYADGINILDAFSSSPNNLVSSRTNNAAIASGLASLGSIVYDVQMLPYCPLLEVSASDYVVKKADDVSYIYSENGTSKIGALMWCSRSQFTFNITNTLDIDDVKLSNECDMYRLCSPNYNGVFEFSPAKNVEIGSNTAITYFKVDCAYKPYTPYIHIAPDFKGLYGGDFNDARGLICAGDFGITSTTDRWAEYQINNKNYLASFDRNIETQELNNKMSRISDISNIPTMATNGGIIGGIKGGPAGIALGATAGLIDSGANLAANEILKRDALDLTRDQFGFQLENIQALPNSLSKVSSINQNNKLFPFLEYYSCTDEEKEALKNKLKYNGMTIGRIGTIIQFKLPDISYIKGKLIRIEGALDYHEVNDLANELNQGVYI